MGFFTKDIHSLEDLFEHALHDLFYAENQILQALPEMIEKATDADLKASFEKHRDETEGHVHRLREVFEVLGAEPKGDKCPAIDGILKEGRDLLGEIEGGDVMNAALVFAAQAVEHYEITRYGALIAYASELRQTDCIVYLKANLAEEKATDQKLTRLAERRYNPQADMEPERKRSSASRTARKPATRTAARSRARGNATRGGAKGAKGARTAKKSAAKKRRRA
jgi:ferritin-like metal-binding protein YciE